MEAEAKATFTKFKMVVATAREKGDLNSKLLAAREEARIHGEEFMGCKKFAPPAPGHRSRWAVNSSEY